ncbi:flagellar basal body rod protein FlgB [Sphingomonas psychrolutea]|uniref:Flagellar basal body rod protein N-terminal domain-containing protein n=1 Tax=Sphingomonas psychrolutea TaxID=1259676 RepID=A0ABQ1H8R6_9SPHN|nr:hypothetical protein GCM10011395_35520 [Sphingomonas psychrolutea]
MPSEGLFGVHGAALEVRSQRMGVLASNIANASTPGFKAQDVDFQKALAAVENAAKMRQCEHHGRAAIQRDRRDRRMPMP